MQKFLGFLTISLIPVYSSFPMQNIIVGSSWSGRDQAIRHAVINEQGTAPGSPSVVGVALGTNKAAVNEIKMRAAALALDGVWSQTPDKTATITQILHQSQDIHSLGSSAHGTIAVINDAGAWISYTEQGLAVLSFTHGIAEFPNTATIDFFSDDAVSLDDGFAIFAQGWDTNKFPAKKAVLFVREKMFGCEVTQMVADDIAKQLIKETLHYHFASCAVVIVFFNQDKKSELFERYAQADQQVLAQEPEQQNDHKSLDDFEPQQMAHFSKHMKECLDAYQEPDAFIQCRNKITNWQTNLAHDSLLFDMIKDDFKKKCALISTAEQRNTEIVEELNHIEALGYTLDKDAQ